MRTVFLPSLLNGLTGDPGLWVDLMDEGRSVLLDLGDLGGGDLRLDRRTIAPFGSADPNLNSE